MAIPGVLDHCVTMSYSEYQPSDPEVAEWRERVKTMFPYDSLSPFNLAGIASALVFVEALKRAGPDLTRDKFLDAMGTIKNFDTGLLPGPLTCNPPVSHQCNRGFAWIRKVGGSIETIAMTVVE